MEINTLVIKVASRCNLNCSYCFMYNQGDTTFKSQPKFMDVDLIDNILEKAKGYIIEKGIKSFSFLFHGGEPLLIDKEFYFLFVEKANLINQDLDEVEFNYEMQTNGVLINEDWCKLFETLNIEASISIDGTKKAHDMYRVDHKGRGSYEKVKKGINLLKEKNGEVKLICVININETPELVYDSFKDLDVDLVNFLFPDYTHDNFPFNKSNVKTQMADWLIQLFDHWVKDPDKIYISFFIGAMNDLIGLGQPGRNEEKAIVIESNGEIEAIDSLKVCGNGFTKTGLNIKSNDLSEITNTQLGKLYFEESSTKLANKCVECPILDVCGGGRLIHRYSKKNGFNNSSVYCDDLVKLYSHIQNYMVYSLPELYSEEKVDIMDYKEITSYLGSIEKNTIKTIHSSELERFQA